MQYRTSRGALNSGWKCGRTLDMSAGGILIDIPQTMPIASILELAMDWPGLYHGKPTVRLFLTASVARIDGRGTALCILSHEFRDVHPAVIRSERLERNLVVA
jgi:hypothetical protein